MATEDRPAVPAGTAGEPPVLDFVVPPPGLPGMTRALLASLDDDGVAFELRPAGEDDGTRLLVVPPGRFFPDYAPVLDDESCTALGLHRAEDALLLVVVTTYGGDAGPTANLLAPVVVNQVSRRAAQVVLADGDLPLRAALV